MISELYLQMRSNQGLEKGREEKEQALEAQRERVKKFWRSRGIS